MWLLRFTMRRSRLSPTPRKITVCIIKAQGKPTLSRECSKLSAVPDPFAVGSVDRPVRVLVVSTTGESAGMRFHMGWRGTVTKVPPSGQVRVNLSYLGDGKALSRQVNVPREHLQILTDDDVSMAPNKHPWVGERVTVEEGSGEVVHVNDQGRVKIKIAQDGSERNKVVVVEGATFELLFNNRASPTAPPPAAPVLQAAEDAEPHVEPREAIPVADSDAESDGGPAPPQLHDSDDEPIAPAARRKKKGGAERKTTKKEHAPRKRPATASAQPKRRVRRKVASPGEDVD